MEEIFTIKCLHIFHATSIIEKKKSFIITVSSLYMNKKAKMLSKGYKVFLLSFISLLNIV